MRDAKLQRAYCRSVPVTPATFRSILAVGLLSCAVVLAGCEAEKSQNPLSPSVAGPLPGVTITAPKPLEPANGTEIVSSSQPVRLLLENASSNSVRPFWFELQIARDAGFASLVHAVERIEPGPGGRTTYQVPLTLPSDQVYYWRSRALDGANTGPFSAAASFRVVVPIVIDTPVPLSPINGETIPTLIPRMLVQNGNVSGPAGTVYYVFEASLDAAMTRPEVVRPVPRSAVGQTALDAVEYGWSQQWFWRVTGVSENGLVKSAPSAVQSFRTPARPAAPAPPAPAPPTTPTPPAPAPPSPTPGYRAPDPAPGQRLPLPDMYWVVEQVARAYPNALRNSCQDHGGSWEFMDRVVDELRRHDLRWSYNAKRGNFRDPSHDVVFYHWAAGPSDGSREGYLMDIIVGHCGSNPQPAWIDQTAATFQGGTTGGYIYPRPGR
jgi:hypothetical protein